MRAGLSSQTKKNNYRDTDFEEINALIGLLLVASVLRPNDEKAHHYLQKMPLADPFSVIFYANYSPRFEKKPSRRLWEKIYLRDNRKQKEKQETKGLAIAWKQERPAQLVHQLKKKNCIQMHQM